MCAPVGRTESRRGTPGVHSVQLDLSPLNKYLSSSCYVPSIVLGSRDTMVNSQLAGWWEMQTSKQTEQYNAISAVRGESPGVTRRTENGPNPDGRLRKTSWMVLGRTVTRTPAAKVGIS